MDILVAGERVWCRPQTLQFVPNSTLAALANHDRNQPPVVDRPIAEFKWILDWCRTLGRKAPPADPERRHNIMVEAEYWGLRELNAQIHTYNQNCGISPTFMEHDINRAALWCTQRQTHNIHHIQLNNGTFVLMAQ